MCWFLPADLTGSELVDQQGTSLRVLPSVKAVQLSGHLVQLFIGIVELCQELRVRPLQRNTRRSLSILVWLFIRNNTKEAQHRYFTTIPKRL